MAVESMSSKFQQSLWEIFKCSISPNALQSCNAKKGTNTCTLGPRAYRFEISAKLDLDCMKSLDTRRRFNEVIVYSESSLVTGVQNKR